MAAMLVLVAYYGDASTKRYEDCEQVVYDLKDGTAGQLDNDNRRYVRKGKEEAVCYRT